jgi:hypothetical protein
VKNVQLGLSWQKPQAVLLRAKLHSLPCQMLLYTFKTEAKVKVEMCYNMDRIGRAAANQSLTEQLNEITLELHAIRKYLQLILEAINENKAGK